MMEDRNTFSGMFLHINIFTFFKSPDKFIFHELPQKRYT